MTHTDPLERYSTPFVSPDGQPVRCSMMKRIDEWPFVKRCDENATRQISSGVQSWMKVWFDAPYDYFCGQHASEICTAYQNDLVDEDND